MKKGLSLFLALVTVLLLLPIATPTVIGEETVPRTGTAVSSYLDLYVKDGLIALFDAYAAEDSDTSPTAWAPADFYQKAGYDSYADPASYTAALTSASGQTWRFKKGALSLSTGTKASGTACLDLSSLFTAVPTLTASFAVQKVTQMVGQALPDGTSTETGAENYSVLTPRWSYYPGVLASNDLIQKHFIVQVSFYSSADATSATTKNLFFNTAAYLENPGKQEITYTKNGVQTTGQGYVGSLPTAVLEQTVALSDTTDAGAGAKPYGYSFSLHFQFAPNKVSSQSTSSRTYAFSGYSAEEPTAAGKKLTLLTGKNADTYSVRIYNRALTEAEMDANHFADLCGFYGLSVVAWQRYLTDTEALAQMVAASATIAMSRTRYDADGNATADFLSAKTAWLNTLADAVAEFAPEEKTYRDLYVKDGLVALFDAYGAEASADALTAWAPVDLYGKDGYTDYIAPGTGTAPLTSANGQAWTFKKGALTSPAAPKFRTTPTWTSLPILPS